MRMPQAAAFLMGETIYFLPFQCLAVHWFCILVTFADWRKKPQGKRAVHLMDAKERKEVRVSLPEGLFDL